MEQQEQKCHFIWNVFGSIAVEFLRTQFQQNEKQFCVREWAKWRNKAKMNESYVIAFEDDERVSSMPVESVAWFLFSRLEQRW